MFTRQIFLCLVVICLIAMTVANKAITNKPHQTRNQSPMIPSKQPAKKSIALKSSKGNGTARSYENHARKKTDTKHNAANQPKPNNKLDAKLVAK